MNSVAFACSDVASKRMRFDRAKKAEAELAELKAQREEEVSEGESARACRMWQSVLFVHVQHPMPVSSNVIRRMPTVAQCNAMSIGISFVHVSFSRWHVCDWQGRSTSWPLTGSP